MVKFEVLSESTLERREYWVSEIVKISGDFGQDATRVELELNNEVASSGEGAILDHLRLCGTIPESYGHDTSEEKLYSKYTDVLLAVAFRAIGFTAVILIERGGVADVEVVGDDYSFVADAKAFRLSRTAKNQKDFKVEAVNGWKRGKPFAMVVCPLHQLPVKSSQIYQQAISRNVCLLSFSHLAVLVAYSRSAGVMPARDLLGQVLGTLASMLPSKDAVGYWAAINRTVLGFDPSINEFWRIEKLANIEAISAAREEGLRYWARRREEIMKLSREEAVQQLITAHKINGRVRAIAACTANKLLDAI